MSDTAKRPSPLRDVDPVFGREAEEIARVRSGLSSAGAVPPVDSDPMTLADYMAYATRKTKRPEDAHVRHLAESFADELNAIFSSMTSGHRYRVVPLLLPNAPGYMGLAPGHEAQFGHLHYHVVRDDGLTLHGSAPVYLQAILPAELIEIGLLLPANFPDAEGYHALVADFEKTVRVLIDRVHGAA